MFDIGLIDSSVSVGNVIFPVVFSMSVWQKFLS